MRDHRPGNRLSGAVIGAALEVHRQLGPGLLESVYSTCLEHELGARKLEFRTEVPVPVQFRGIEIDCGYRVDLLVEDRLIVELKAVRTLDDIHVAQVLTYLVCTKLPLGLLINFNVPLLKDGIRRVANMQASPSGPL